MRILDKLLGRADAARPLASGTRLPARRIDGYGGRWTNTSSGQGGSLDRHAQTEFLPPVALDQVTVDALLRFQAVGRRIVTREPDDCTREGYELTGMPAEVARSVLGAADGNEDDGTPGLDVLKALRKARSWARAFGGGGIYILADDGRLPHEPLDVANLRAINGLEVFDRFELVVSAYGLDPRDRATFNRPTFYTTAGYAGLSERIHASRIVPMQGIEVPMRVMIQNGGWGGSVLDLVWAELRNYASTNDYVTEAVSILSQGVLATKGLADAIDAGDEQYVVDRVEALRMAMGILGDIAIDKETESYEVKARSISGIGEAGKLVVDALVAATDMPRSILLGETPGGLNAGENLGELEAWYGHCASLQRPIYTPPLRRILALLMLSKFGPTRGQLVPGWGVKWLPLWTLDEVERADLDLKRAQRRQVDLMAGVVTRDEARREPALVQVYGHDPALPAPAPIVEPPGNEVEEGLDDLDEVQPLQAADPSTFPADERPVRARDVAERLGVTPSTVIKMATRGDFPAWRISNRWRFAMSTVEDYMRRGHLRALPP